jgi:hypothetical protein
MIIVVIVSGDEGVVAAITAKATDAEPYPIALCASTLI